MADAPWEAPAGATLAELQRACLQGATCGCCGGRVKMAAYVIKGEQYVFPLLFDTREGPPPPRSDRMYKGPPVTTAPWQPVNMRRAYCSHQCANLGHLERTKGRDHP